MSPDERHEDVVRRYPGGLNPAQFRHEALVSADEDGKLDPPALADWFKQQSLLIGMWMDGLIEKRCRRDEAGPWYITPKGATVAQPANTGSVPGSPSSYRARPDEPNPDSLNPGLQGEMK